MKLPEEVGNCIRLKELDVSENMLYCLPASIGMLSRLEALNFSCNLTCYQDVPTAIREPNIRDTKLNFKLRAAVKSIRQR